MTYRPIACDFYDELTLRAMRCSVAEIRYVDEEGQEHVVQAVVEDVFTRGDEEYLRLESGMEIRLDRILAIDGIRQPGTC